MCLFGKVIQFLLFIAVAQAKAESDTKILIKNSCSEPIVLVYSALSYRNDGQARRLSEGWYSLESKESDVISVEEHYKGGWVHSYPKFFVYAGKRRDPFHPLLKSETAFCTPESSRVWFWYIHFSHPTDASLIFGVAGPNKENAEGKYSGDAKTDMEACVNVEGEFLSGFERVPYRKETENVFEIKCSQ